MSRVVRWTRLVGAASALLFSACADEPLTAPTVSANQVFASVTPEVASELDAQGHFRFVPLPSGDLPHITEARARELALAYWRTFESSLRAPRERQRGAGIASSLTVCSRAYYVESGYEPMPMDLPREYRRAFGDQWLVGLCKGKEQQLAISVSVEAADLTTNTKGEVYGVRSGDFRSIAVEPGATLPAAPELGAVEAAKQIGKRISGVPTLRRLGHRFSPFNSVWVYPIEEPALILGTESREIRETQTLAFGFHDGLRDLRVLQGNPNYTDESREERLSVLWEGTTPREFTLMRRADIPIRWEPVTRGTN